MNKNRIVITGIDTDCGKTVVTGLLAKWMIEKGYDVTTQKMIQTGCEKISEDIESHRSLMQIPFTEEDLEGWTCGQIFKIPASPHLAAREENKEVDCQKIWNDATFLAQNHQFLLMEGAGGLMVPLTESFSTLDFIKEHRVPILLVSSSKLGSINHTLLSLMAIAQYDIPLWGVIYNRMPGDNLLMTNDTERYIKDYLCKHFPKTPLVAIDALEQLDRKEIDFSPILDRLVQEGVL